MEMEKNKVRAAYDGASEIGFNGHRHYPSSGKKIPPITLSNDLSFEYHQTGRNRNDGDSLLILASFTLVPRSSLRFGRLEVVTGKQFSSRKLSFGLKQKMHAFTHWISDSLMGSEKQTKFYLSVFQSPFQES